MRKLILTLACVFLLTACQHETTKPTPTSEGDALITKEYIDEHIDNFYLDLSNLGLTKVPNFAEIATAVQKEDIIYLNLSNNEITEISEDLLVLVNLKELKLDNNKITKLENIQDVKLLNRIEAYKNQIEEVDIKNLPGLVELDLAYNNLSSEDIASLNQLTSVESLQLQHNNLESIKGVEVLENLKTLKIESNQISDVSVLEQLENLENVTVGNNPLPETEIEKWKEFNQVNK